MNCKYQPLPTEEVDSEFCTSCQEMAPEGCERVGKNNNELCPRLINKSK